MIKNLMCILLLSVVLVLTGCAAYSVNYSSPKVIQLKAQLKRDLGDQYSEAAATRLIEAASKNALDKSGYPLFSNFNTYSFWLEYGLDDIASFSKDVYENGKDASAVKLDSHFSNNHWIKKNYPPVWMQAKPQIVKAPDEWAAAKAFEKIEKGIFYIDVAESATYRKGNGGLDRLEFFFSTIWSQHEYMQMTKGRLQDYFIYYKFLGLGDPEYSSKEINLPRLRSTIAKDVYNGVWFTNTASLESNQKLRYISTAPLQINDCYFNLFVTADQALALGRDATFRVFFSIDNDSDSKYHSEHEGYLKATATEPELYKSKEFRLYAGRFLGVQILYKERPLRAPLIAVFDDTKSVDVTNLK